MQMWNDRHRPNLIELGATLTGAASISGPLAPSHEHDGQPKGQDGSDEILISSIRSRKRASPRKSGARRW